MRKMEGWVIGLILFASVGGSLAGTFVYNLGHQAGWDVGWADAKMIFQIPPPRKLSDMAPTCAPESDHHRVTLYRDAKAKKRLVCGKAGEWKLLDGWDDGSTKCNGQPCTLGEEQPQRLADADKLIKQRSVLFSKTDKSVQCDASNHYCGAEQKCNGDSDPGIEVTTDLLTYWTCESGYWKFKRFASSVDRRNTAPTGANYEILDSSKCYKRVSGPDSAVPVVEPVSCSEGVPFDKLPPSDLTLTQPITFGDPPDRWTPDKEGHRWVKRSAGECKKQGMSWPCWQLEGTFGNWMN